ncbi:MAG: hypothetical protein GF383_05925 [Candidatus Lokiarchaeota archaeon]|nr:hypothetical protein [Candidatus Lokiarchaeota archaeon]MBD3339480.1 hypothetical protein [Candidatus Lokiarchaeota archaeon]
MTEINKIRDFSNLTCTNLMIKLKILLKKLNKGNKLEFYSNREQYDNIKKPFSKKSYKLKGDKIGDNKYHILITKIK